MATRVPALIQLSDPRVAAQLVDLLTEKVMKEVPDSMVFADDVVLCGSDEVDMTENL